MELLDIFIVFVLSSTIIVIAGITLIKVLNRNPNNRLNQLLALTFFSYLLHFILVLHRTLIPASQPLSLCYVSYKISFYFLGMGSGFLLRRG